MRPTSNQLIRVRLDETDDSGKQQTVKTRGRARELIGGSKKKVPRVGTHGLASHPWKGSHGYAIAIGGNLDQVQVQGLEHPEKRLKNLKEGDAALYRDADNYAWFKDGELHVKSTGKVFVEAATEIRLKAPKIVLESDDIRLGGDDASRPVAAIHTIDTGGFEDIDNLLTKVKGK